MVSTDTQLNKADKPLRQRLSHARGEEVVCAILGLADAPTTYPPPPPIEDFPSRTQWRLALVERDEAILLAAVGDTLAALRQLGLEVRNWQLGMAVVRGPASAVAAALGLAGVQDAVLDYEMVITEEQDLAVRVDAPPTPRLAPQAIVADPPSNQENLAPLETPPAHAGEYALQQRIGRGGMGEVHRAINLRTGEIVAVKLIRAHLVAGWDGPGSAVARFLLEGRIGRELAHPHIVPVFDTGTLSDGRHFIVMEYYSGGDLQTLRGLFRDSLPAAKLLAGLARTMQFVHEHGAIHRDLKPGNILFRDASDPESFAIGDFGLARRLSESGGTPARQFMGSLRYASPEQLVDARSVDGRTDIYALGAILYYLLTNSHAVEMPSGESLTQYAENRRTLPPSSPRRLRADVPAELNDICRTCLEPCADHRYQSAAEFAEDLERFIASVGQG